VIPVDLPVEEALEFVVSGGTAFSNVLTLPSLRTGDRAAPPSRSDRAATASRDERAASPSRSERSAPPSRSGQAV